MSLYSVAAGLAVDCVRQAQPAMVHALVDCLGEFVRKTLATWLRRRGGWVRGVGCRGAWQGRWLGACRVGVGGGDPGSGGEPGCRVQDSTARLSLAPPEPETNLLPPHGVGRQSCSSTVPVPPASCPATCSRARSSSEVGGGRKCGTHAGRGDRVQPNAKGGALGGGRGQGLGLLWRWCFRDDSHASGIPLALRPSCPEPGWGWSPRGRRSGRRVPLRVLAGLERNEEVRRGRLLGFWKAPLLLLLQGTCPFLAPAQGRWGVCSRPGGRERGQRASLLPQCPARGPWRLPPPSRELGLLLGYNLP